MVSDHGGVVKFDCAPYSLPLRSDEGGWPLCRRPSRQARTARALLIAWISNTASRVEATGQIIGSKTKLLKCFPGIPDTARPNDHEDVVSLPGFPRLTTTAAALLATIIGHSSLGYQTWLIVGLAGGTFTLGFGCFWLLGRHIHYMSTRVAHIEKRIDRLPGNPNLLTWESEHQQRGYSQWRRGIQLGPGRWGICWTEAFSGYQDIAYSGLGACRAAMLRAWTDIGHGSDESFCGWLPRTRRTDYFLRHIVSGGTVIALLGDPSLVSVVLPSGNQASLRS